MLNTLKGFALANPRTPLKEVHVVDSRAIEVQAFKQTLKDLKSGRSSQPGGASGASPPSFRRQQQSGPFMTLQNTRTGNSSLYAYHQPMICTHLDLFKPCLYQIKVIVTAVSSADRFERTAYILF